MRVRGLPHLPQSQIQPFREQHIEQADLVTARDAGSQMGEGFGKSDVSSTSNKMSMIRTDGIRR
jgi:hypothetical protein